MRILSSILALTLVAACTVRTPVGQANLGPNPAMAGGTFTSPGGVTVAAEVRNFQGKTGICGVWSVSDKQSVLTKMRAQRVLEPSSVVLGNEALLTGLQFLREVPAMPRGSYGGVEADCVVLQRAWTPKDEGKPVKVVMPRQTVYQDFDLSGGIRVIFRPSGPSAHPDDPKPWQ